MTIDKMKQVIIQSGRYTAAEVAAMITGEILLAYIEVTEGER